MMPFPGQIMSASALLATNPRPTDADEAMSGNICPCGIYVRIREAIAIGERLDKTLRT